jgi:hypothetical protein
MLLFAVTASIPAQEEEGAAVPEPYRNEEFAPWLHDIRRAEVLFIGSFPITMFFSNLGFQLTRYFRNDRNREYAPSIFGGLQRVPFEEEEKKRILLTAISLSGALTVADFIIDIVLDKKSRIKDSNETP